MGQGLPADNLPQLTTEPRKARNEMSDLAWRLMTPGEIYPPVGLPVELLQSAISAKHSGARGFGTSESSSWAAARLGIAALHLPAW